MSRVFYVIVIFVLACWWSCALSITGRFPVEKVTIRKVLREVWVEGKCSTFGGLSDGRQAGNNWSHVPSEGLALWSKHEVGILLARGLVLAKQPAKTTGLARRLNQEAFYVAARWPGWDGSDRGRVRRWIRDETVRVESVETGWSAQAWPVDYGPHESTGRDIDISPGLALALGVGTDDTLRLYLPVRPSR